MIRAALALLVAALLALPALAASTWTESWADTSAWTPITQQCSSVSGGQLIMICQSAALQSIQTWDHRQPITLSGAVSGEPAPGSSTTAFWGGLVLFQADRTYAELAVARGVTPANETPVLQSLTLPKFPAGRALGPAVPGQRYAFKIDWDPVRSRITYSVNGHVEQQVRQSFGGPIRLWTICVSQSENRPDNGSSARCVFGPLTVAGTPL